MRIASQFRRMGSTFLVLLPLLSAGCVSQIVKKEKLDPVDVTTKDDGSDAKEIDETDLIATDAVLDVVPDEILDLGDQDVPEVEIFEVDITVGQTAVIGPTGGTFFLEGGVTLVVPAGAVDEEVTVSIVPGANQKPAGVTAVTSTWKASPDGQQFKLPITLRLPLEDPGLDAGQWPLVKGFVGAGADFDSVPAWPDLNGQEAWIQTSHFSYLLAGLPAPKTVCLAHELCDGEDNDCDGAVDEAADLITTDDSVTGCATQGVCALNVDVACVEGEWNCQFKDPDSPPTLFEEGVELSCDAKDNDCDGLIDEDLVGKVEVLESFGVLDIECRTEGVCSSANVLAACWKKTANSADWVCDYSGVAGFEGEEELTCDSSDNDCDGEIDEGTCKLNDPCASDTACATGHCVVPLGGENFFCTASPDSCLAVQNDAFVVEIGAGGTWCFEEMAHHKATCNSGVWSEPYDCSKDELVNPVCDPSTKQCAGGCDFDEDCNIFEEPCTGNFVCNEQSECEEEPGTGPQCYTLNWVCQEFFCEPDSGDCLASSEGEGVSCDDGDACTGNGKCEEGSCTGAPEKTCNDENGCTNDYCDPETGGCIYDTAEFLGAPCDDASICTTYDVCQEDGSCDGQMKPCDDGNVCTADACDEATGECKFVLTPGVDCDDTDPCTLPGTCSEGGQCVMEPVDCDDHNDCTTDGCVLGDCSHDSVQPSSLCLYPSSAPGAQNVCIPLGLCDDQGGCQAGEDFCECHSHDDCLTSDENLCDGTGTCEIGEGGLLVCEDQPGTVVVCDPSGDSQCLANICDVSTGLCGMEPLELGTACSDGDECTDEDQCIDGSCIGTVQVDCDDGNECTNNLCDSDAGCLTSPVAQGTPCQDGEPCTLADKCDAAGACIPGSPKFPVCDDDNICTTDTCTADGSGCLYEPIAGCCASSAECNVAGGEICTGDNVCCAPVCVDDQGQVLECGSDGCGDVCGECGINAVCAEGNCCYPNCYSPAKLCGDDGCGGSCGSCDAKEVCTQLYECCVPGCAGRQCGPDGCGGDCGNCSSGFICEEEAGKCESCTPACDGKDCGDDGCGGVCGQCGEGAKCLGDGTCCTPNCDGKECGGDGCDGTCASCLDWQACTPAGQCECDACCALHEDCGPTELCGATVQEGEQNFIICYEPLTFFLDGFESYNKDQVPDVFFYSPSYEASPWLVKVGAAPFTTNTGVRSLRYYLVGIDSGGYFSFKRHLAVVGEEGLSMLSFSVRCNSEFASFTLSVKAGQADLLVIDDSSCEQGWQRYVVDLSPLSGLTEFKFVVDKVQTPGAEIFIDDLVLFVSECPSDVSCAGVEVQDNACEVSSIDAGNCLLDWACYADGEVSESIECARCDSVTNQSEWIPDDGLCDDGNPATNDKCDTKEGCFHFF
jgi:hypothetical protein